MIKRVLLVASDVFVRRLTPALSGFARGGMDFRIIDIARSASALSREIRAIQPHGIITEALPVKTKMLVGLGFPTVIADSDHVFPGVVSIDVDDESVGAEAARFFLLSGYRNFACVENGTPYASQRSAGFCNLVEAAGHEVRVFTQRGRLRSYMESWNEEAGALAAWLRDLPKPVAVFAAHDPLGRLVCDAAARTGVHVPEDLAVIGANNDALVCGLSYPPLSSVEIPWDRIGELAGTWMVGLLDGKRAPGQAVLVAPGPVVIRQSTTLIAVDDLELRRFLQFVRNNFAQPLSVGWVCDRLHLSRRAVERKAQHHLHASPWEVLCRIRVDAAKSELLQTDRSMSEIAEKCGFGNAEQLSVSFRRYAGCPPTVFRKGVVR